MTIKIHGKDYTPVNDRIKLAGDNLLAVETEVLLHEPVVVMKATIKIAYKNGEFKTFTGISSANPAKAIEKENPYEVAETSAVGRALGFAGYGIDTSIASADEMVKATAPTMADRQEAQSDHFCQVHNKDLKERVGPDGIVWDHRSQIDGVWNVCYGQKWIPQNSYKKDEIPERQINE